MFNKIHSTKQAFTLIELLIVISIIGLLVILLFPKLEVAQERSRDTGRLTAIKNTAWVLKTFSAETWKKYPRSPSDTTELYTSWDGCLSTSSWQVHPELWVFLLAWKAPLDPQKNTISYPCNTKMSLWYASLSKNWIDWAWFVLSTNMESYKNANCHWSDTLKNCSFWTEGTTKFSDIELSSVGFLNTKTPNANDSLYVEKN